MKTIMKHLSCAMRLTAAILVVFCLTAGAEAPTLKFNFTTIDVPGALETWVEGINNSGAMVGQYIDSSGHSHGFKLIGSKVTNIDDPNGGTSCEGINLKGDIVGYWVKSNAYPQAFLYKGGKFTDIGPAGAQYSAAFGINDKDYVAGYFADSNNQLHGFLWNGKTYTTLGVPKASFTEAWGINNKAQVTVAWGDSAGNYEGAIYQNKKYTIVNVPGATDTIPHGIDTAGDIAFLWYDSANGLWHGALKHLGKFYKFDDPKASASTFARGINDHKVIVGNYATAEGGDSNGFKATY